MRIDKQCLWVGVIAAVAALGGCRSGTPGSAESDSAAAPARTDTQPASPPAVGAASTIRSDSVLLKTDRTEYKAGAQVTLTLENRSGATYAFNPCTRSIEHEDGNVWTAIAEPDRMCTMQAYMLDPRATRTEATDLPASLTPGRYRVVVRLTAESPGAGSAITAVSDPITVT